MIPQSFKRLIQGREKAFICLLLAVATIIVFGRVRHFEFINFDDPFIIYNNPIVTQGWTLHGFIWGLTTSYFEYWHPITWWSHMTDCQFFGLSAGWHHLVSLGFHILNTLLLFGAVYQMTGKMIRSAVVAALFALHPMHVESVVWLAERKDLLCTFFWILSVRAYACYVQKSEAKLPEAEFFFRLSLAAFIGGLMSKPMVVTLPFVLLLLDYWPLNRLQMVTGTTSIGALKKFTSLAQEKIPFFALTIVSCAITYSNAKSANNILSTAVVPWDFRIENMPISYARYLGKLFWPGGMSVLYPLPKHWGLTQVAGSIVLLFIISVVAVKLARPAPYLIIGWLMFLGIIFPTLSLVPVGFQSIADRYTYLGYIGLFMAIVWAVADACVRWRIPASLVAGTTVVILCASGYLSWVQLGYWRSNLTLWPHCLAVTSDNLTANYNYAFALQNAGQIPKAIPYYRAALRIDPNHLNANLNFGRALAATGQFQEATNYFAKAIRLKPDSGDAHGNMGMALFVLGDYSNAVVQSSESLRLDPTDIRSMVCLGRSLAAENKSDDAIEAFTRALQTYPNRAEPHFYLGLELLKRGAYDSAIEHLSQAVNLAPNYDEARTQLALAQDKRAMSALLAQYRDALRQHPDSFEALNNLAWILATQSEPEFRNGAEALQLAKHACEMTDNKQVVPIGTLAAAYAEGGQFDKAVETAQRACDLAVNLGQTNLLEKNRELLAEFKKNQPHHERTIGSQ